MPMQNQRAQSLGQEDAWRRDTAISTSVFLPESYGQRCLVDWCKVLRSEPEAGDPTHLHTQSLRFQVFISSLLLNIFKVEYVAAISVHIFFESLLWSDLKMALLELFKFFKIFSSDSDLTPQWKFSGTFSCF